MKSSKKYDAELMGKIVEGIKKYTKMVNPLTVEAAVLKATREIVGERSPKQYVVYAKLAEEKYLDWLKDRLERKKELLLRGAQEAAWARRDEEVEEAEKNEELLSELRAQEGSRK